MNTSFDITDIDCAPKELEDALGVSGRTLFDPTEHPIHVDIWDGKAKEGFYMETITTWFSIICAVVSVITIFINLWLNS